MTDSASLLPEDFGIKRDMSAGAVPVRFNLYEDILTWLTRYPIFHGVVGKRVELTASLGPTATLLMRVFTVEIWLARELGLLTGHTPRQRYSSFFGLADTTEYREYISFKYKLIPHRLDSIGEHLSESMTSIDTSWASVRSHFGEVGSSVARIKAVGDYHGVGHQTWCVVLSNGSVFYAKRRQFPAEPLVHTAISIVQRETSWALPTPTYSMDDRELLLWQRQVDETNVDLGAMSLPQLRKNGIYLAIAYLLDLRDLHHENLLQTPEGPLAIDLECSLVAAVNDPPRAREPLFRDARSVLDAYILPRRRPRRSAESSASEAWDNTSLAHHRDDLAMLRHMSTVENDGTDQLLIRPAKDAEDESVHISIDQSDRDVLSPDRLRALLQGFRAAYRALVEHTDELAAASPQGMTVRVLPRNTQFYQDLIRLASSHPIYWADPVQRQRRLSELLRGTGRPSRTLVKEEQGALEEFAIPVFEHHVSATAIEDFFGELSSSEDDSLSESEVQERVLTQHLLSVPEQSIISSVGDDRCQQEMGLLAQGVEALAHYAFSASDGLRHSILREESEYDWAVKNVSLGLYDGAAGVLLAAATAMQSGVPTTPTTRRELEGLATELATCLAQQISHIRSGFYSGAPGILYALLVARKEHLAEDQLVAQAQEAVIGRLETDLLNMDSIELLSGVSGVACFLQSLKGGLRQQHLMDSVSRVLASAEELIASRVLGAMCSGNSDASRETQDVLDLGGLSHGVTGPFLALVNSSESTPKIAEAREILWKTQQQMFSAERNNWEDKRGYADDSYAMDSWCHGAEGIFGALKHAGEEARVLGHHISFDLQAWLDSPRPRSTSMCHGLSGRLSLVDDMVLDRPSDRAVDEQSQLREILLSELSRTLKSPFSRTWLDHSLFLGLGGVIYSLSRLPERSGNVLYGSLPEPQFGEQRL